MAVTKNTQQNGCVVDRIQRTVSAYSINISIRISIRIRIRISIRISIRIRISSIISILSINRSSSSTVFERKKCEVGERKAEWRTTMSPTCT